MASLITCNCYQRLYDCARSGHHSCSCNTKCYACHNLCYGYQEQNSCKEYGSLKCACDSTCYQESLTCSCNAAEYLKYEMCSCDTTCYSYEGCSTDGCNGYTCTCDFQDYEESCAQCHMAIYDYNTKEIIPIENPSIPTCTCDGRYTSIEEQSVCICNETRDYNTKCATYTAQTTCSTYLRDRYK